MLLLHCQLIVQSPSCTYTFEIAFVSQNVTNLTPLLRHVVLQSFELRPTFSIFYCGKFFFYLSFFFLNCRTTASARTLLKVPTYFEFNRKRYQLANIFNNLAPTSCNYFFKSGKFGGIYFQCKLLKADPVYLYLWHQHRFVNIEISLI